MANVLVVALSVVVTVTFTAADLPRWAPVWQLNRSTAANVCNRSGYIDYLPMGGDLGEFGMVNFDWSNNRATWMRNNTCEQDLIAQCKITKASSARHPGPETKTLVYRGGEMSLNYMADQIAVMGDLARNPHDMTFAYKGFFVAYNNGTTWVCKAGHCFNQLIWDFRNESARDYYVNTVVGSEQFGIRNPVVSGMFFDDIGSLGLELPGLLADLQWSAREVHDWNVGANATVAAARALMHEHDALNWQELHPMTAPEQSTCARGGGAGPGGVGQPETFRGLEALCGGGGVDGVPLFMHVYPGRGIQRNLTDCLPDCPKMPDADQIIAAFLLARGAYAWLGYEYNGCANAIDSPYKNQGGMNYWAPSLWSDVMAEDFGQPAGGCKESSPGVFERTYKNGQTVSLDCNTWEATFDRSIETVR
jgi:hypothetical protein